MTRIKTAVNDGASSLAILSDSPFLDAEILLCKALGKDRSFLRAWPDRELTSEQLHTYQNLLLDRQQGKPIAYLTGTREFWSRDFLVSPDVLIPRADTELLIELSLALIPPDQPFKIIDLGTGSGIIAITLAAERPCAHVYATDRSEAALQMAQVNAVKHQVEHIQFYQSNWFADIPTNTFNLIVSNPPYIAEGDPHLLEGDLRFEPITALVAEQQGLADIRHIAETARNWLAHDGFLLVEHGYNQGQAVQQLFKILGYHTVQTHSDLSGQPRVTSGRYQAPR